MPHPNLITPQEVIVIQMALSAIIEDLESCSKDGQLPFDPQSRKDMKDILANAKSALSKISKTSGKPIQIDPYKEGDESKFFTKQS